MKEEKENTHSVEVDYPKIRGILKSWYKDMYNGAGSSKEEEKDSNDYSSVYNSVEKEIDKEIVTILQDVQDFCNEDDKEIREYLQQGIDSHTE